MTQIWTGLTIAGFDGLDRPQSPDTASLLPSQIALRPLRFDNLGLFAASTIHFGNAGELAYQVSVSSDYGPEGVVLERVAIGRNHPTVFLLPDAEGDPDRSCPGEYWVLDKLVEEPRTGVYRIYERHEDLSANQAAELLRNNQRVQHPVFDHIKYGFFNPSHLIGRVYHGPVVKPPPQSGYLSLEPPTGPIGHEEAIVAMQHRTTGYEVSTRWYGEREPFYDQIMHILAPSRGSVVTILKLIDPETQPTYATTLTHLKEGAYIKLFPDLRYPGCLYFVNLQAAGRTSAYLKMNAPHFYEQRKDLPGFIGRIEAYLTWG